MENAKSLEQYKESLKYAPPGAVNYGNSELMEAWNGGKVFCAIMWAAVGQYIDEAQGRTSDDRTPTRPPDQRYRETEPELLHGGTALGHQRL